MAKKKRSKPKPPAPAKAASPLSHAAFAGLANLREALPPTGDEAVASPDAVGAEVEGKPPAANASAPDALPLPTAKVVVRREKKGRAGKTVTRVTGLARSESDAQRWAKKLKRQLGCGAAVEADDVLLQGDLLERVAVLLEAAGVRRVIRGN